MNELTIEEIAALKKALRSAAFRNLMGAEEWDLTEQEEETLWSALEKLETT